MYKCEICKKEIDGWDTYEYRGFTFCEEHFDEGVAKVDHKRQEVMKVTNASTESQRKGEFVNNSSKYDIHNVVSDGLPIIKVKEPQILKDYEDGIL